MKKFEFFFQDLKKKAKNQHCTILQLQNKKQKTFTQSNVFKINVEKTSSMSDLSTSTPITKSTLKQRTQIHLYSTLLQKTPTQPTKYAHNLRNINYNDGGKQPIQRYQNS